MSDESRVRELLARWDRLRADGVTASVEELCADCPELAGTVRQRLHALEAMDRLLDLDAATGDAEASTLPPADDGAAPGGTGAPVGDRYRPLRLHARGGLGEVFVARDEEVPRDVALKRIQRAHAGHPASRVRFLREAEITGRLEHPGVVPVYGLGTEADGRPFYAMRFIAGQTLQEATDALHARPPESAERNLAVRQLLARFVAVCNTLAYAHSRGVIHRDLKPANIMLGPFGETLVVDWGLAKPVDQSTEAEPGAVQSGADTVTRTGNVLGTPAYMSPEQAEGRGDLGPAADVFGLGATLYAVLTGRPPYRGDHLHSVIDRARAADFPRPRAINPAVPRPLEAVCLKAMARDPAGRYPAALELAADVERWLADEPVSAWPEPWTVRAWRWVRRHRSWVLAGSAAVVFAAVCLATATVLLAAARDRERDTKITAERERDRAAKNFRLARQAVDDYFTKVSQDTLLRVPRMKPLRQRLLRTALDFHEKFLAEAGDDPSVRADRARAILSLGVITVELGEADRAAGLFTAAAAAYQALADENPSDPEYRLKLAECHNRLGIVQRDRSRPRDAEAAFLAALRVREQRPEADRDEPRFLHDLASLHNNLAACYLMLGEADRAKGSLDTARGLYQKAVDAAPLPEHRENLAKCVVNLGVWYSRARRTADAEGEFTTALRMYQELADANQKNPDYQFGLAHAHELLGGLYTAGKANADKVVPFYTKAIAGYAALAEAEPEVPAYQASLAGAHNDLAAWYHRTRRPKDEEQSLRASRDIVLRLTRIDPENPRYRHRLAVCHNNLGLFHNQLDEWAKAEPELREGVRLYEQLAAEKSEVVQYAIDLGSAYGNLGEALRGAGKTAGAFESYGRSVAVLERAVSREPGHGVTRQNLHNAHCNLAELFSDAGEHAKALRYWDRAIELADGEPRIHTRANRALTLARMGEDVRAAAEARAVDALNPPGGDTRYQLAAAFAAAAGAVGRDARRDPGERERLADEYAAASLTQLKKSAELGDFKNPRRAEQLRRDPDFAALIARPEFRSWLDGQNRKPGGP